MSSERILLTLRLLSGAVFVAFGAGKFIDHASELASFKGYGLPLPGLLVVAIGVLELAGGALLIAGRLVRPAAAALAGDMAVAILISGVAHDEPISLTLAPAELAVMLLLLWNEGARQRRTGRPASPPYTAHRVHSPLR